MEKTVLVVVGNNLSSSPCGQGIALELSQGSAKAGKTPAATPGKGIPSIPKSVWTCCVEAVSEYCRVVLDLFPNQYQVCVAAVDEAKCQPINSWRDEDQDINKVMHVGAHPAMQLGFKRTTKHQLIFLACVLGVLVRFCLCAGFCL
jgi:hypothetical protein